MGDVGRKLTHLLVLVEANEAEVEVVHACMGEEGDGFSRTAQV